MKRNNILITACIMITYILAGTARAQQTQLIKPDDINYRIQQSRAKPVYTYKIFQAPNKMYGYDIFKNGRIVFHQGASPIASNDFLSVLSKKGFADKAALRSVEKMKKNLAPALTQEEIKKIAVK